MFTVEMDTDNGESSTITTLDSYGEYDDVEVTLFDDVVYIRQVDDTDLVNVIIMSPNQWLDIVSAMKLPSGAYYRGGTVSV
jgi:hypothetical protein